jgi:hypothetical protein
VETESPFDVDTAMLEIYNTYLIVKSESPVTVLPIDCHLSISQRTGVSNTVKNVLLSVLNSINEEEDLENAYAVYHSILDTLDLSTYSDSQQDTIAKVLYILDVGANWVLNDPLFDFATQFNSNQIIPRGAPWPRRIPWAGWKCFGSIALGGLAGSAGGWVGAAAGVWFGMLEGCDL